MLRLHAAVAAGNELLVREYLDAGDDVNDMTQAVTNAGVADPSVSDADKMNRPPLHLAALHGHIIIGKMLVAAGANVNQHDRWKNRDGNTAFAIAMANYNYGFANMLNKLGATDDTKNLRSILKQRRVEDVLFQAIINKDPRVVSDIYECDLLSKEEGEYALLSAAKMDSPKVLETLLEYGVSPNIMIDNEIPLCEAVGINSVRGVKHLLMHGANIKSLGLRDLNVLVLNGLAEILALLLAHGLDPNTRIYNDSLFEVCFKRQKMDLCIQIINLGADVSFRDFNHRSYLHRCNNLQLFQLLVAKGLDMSAEDSFGHRPLHYASTEICRYIAVSTCPPLTQILTQFSPQEGNVFSAVRNLVTSIRNHGYLEKLQLLLGSGIKFDILQFDTAHHKVEDKWTLLHESFWQNSGFVDSDPTKTYWENVIQNRPTVVIELLIGHGALPLKNKEGRTPLMCMPRLGLDRKYAMHLIERFYKFEANYHQVNPELYKSELIKYYAFPVYFPSYSPGFFSLPDQITTSMGLFWQKVMPVARVDPVDLAESNVFQPIL